MIDANSFRDIAPGSRVLMGPGPSHVSARVLNAMAAPCIGHLDSYFLEKMNETQQLLRYVFETENALTIPISATGSAGMEACLVNLVEPGDKVVVAVNGVFGTRMCDIVERLEGELIRVDFPWGRAVDAQVVREAVKKNGADLICLVHAETSTGAASSLTDMKAVATEAGALLLADCVTSLGGMPVKADEVGLDAAYSGTQKCLSCPPGLSPITFGPAALDKLNARKSKVVSWYLDLTMVGSYWGNERKYHHTAPINMIYGLREALRIVAEEGLEARFARHEKCHQALVAGVEAMGLSLLVPAGERLPMLNNIVIPEGADDAGVRGALMKNYGLEIGGGLGDLAGKVWRVGIMGSTATQRNVTLFLGALESILKTQGVKVNEGALSAATEVFAG